jgi:hypothetical protein
MYILPVPSVVTWHYRSLKENFDHNKDYYTSDDSPETSPKKKIGGPDGSYEPAENILTTL